MKHKDPLSEQIRGNTPMLVLAVLGRHSLHGYAIARRIEEDSEGDIPMGEATIYPILRALERDGLISGEWMTPTLTGVPRKVFSITDKGRQELDAKCSFFTKINNAFLRVMNGGKQDESPA